MTSCRDDPGHSPSSRTMWAWSRLPIASICYETQKGLSRDQKGPHIPRSGLPQHSRPSVWLTVSADTGPCFYDTVSNSDPSPSGIHNTLPSLTSVTSWKLCRPLLSSMTLMQTGILIDSPSGIHTPWEVLGRSQPKVNLPRLALSLKSFSPSP